MDVAKLADKYVLATTPTVLNGVFLSMAQRHSLAMLIRQAYVSGFQQGVSGGQQNE